MTSFQSNHKRRETDENNDKDTDIETGSRSIYLDFYEKGKRWIEYLNLFLVPDDAPDARRLNEAAMAKANEIKSKRMLGIDEDETEADNDNTKQLPKRILRIGLTAISKELDAIRPILRQRTATTVLVSI